MEFFFPDSLDLVDPKFDFVREQWAPDRVRQRDDHYAHEMFDDPPFDGILVSKGIVDGCDSGSRYTIAQRHRLLRLGLREFFRLDNERCAHLKTMGDCGAFAYAKEKEPPYTAREVADFYEQLGIDIGISPDHIVFQYNPQLDETIPGLDCVPEECTRRQQITLDLATDFLAECQARGGPFEPMAVAHGWSPNSYKHSVNQLQKMGYERIALGGLVPLKTHEIAEVVESAGEIRRPGVEFHLLGVTRLSHLEDFAEQGVTSFDSTSPLRKAFKDGQDNYFAEGRTYPAIRVPQSDKNPNLKRRIQKGDVNSTLVRRTETRCLEALFAFGKREQSLEETLEVLFSYCELCGLGDSYFNAYREVLTDRPWETCDCSVCRDIGINVMLFRGAERNRRRGFHNLYVFHRQFLETAGRT